MMINANSLHQNCIAKSSLKPHKLHLVNSRTFHGSCWCEFFVTGSSSTGKSNKRIKARILVRACSNGENGDYKRIPMDTAGAYQLVDEKSGERYIVWGGADDDSHVTPSKDVLAWTPAKIPTDTKRTPRGAKVNQGREVESYVSRNVLPTVRGGSNSSDGVGRNFGRLKLDGVRRVLARKMSPIRKDDVDDYDDNVIVKKTAKGYREFSTSRRNDTNEYGDNVIVKKTAKSYAPTTSPIWRKDVNEYDDNVIVKKTVGNYASNESNAKVEYTPRKVRRKDAVRGQDSVSETTEFEKLRDPEQKNKELYSEKAPKYENKVAEFDSPAPKNPSAYLSKWGNVDGESVGNFRTEAHGSMQRLRKSSTDRGFFSRKSFKELGCNDYLIESLRSLLFLRPSQIQAMAFPPVVQGKSCIITDQSGSGKTLAYLIPVIQRLRDEELQGLSKSTSQSPRVVILVPTAELATQVLSNCRAISKSGVPFRSMVVTGGFRQKTQLESLQQELDVIIATPGRFLYLVNEGFLQLKNIRCVVLDEVDILFRDEDFDSALQRLMNSSPLTTQYLFVTATLPIEAYNKLVESFPDCEVVMGPSMHRVSSGLEEVLVDCSGDYGDERNPETAFANKKSALLRIVEGDSISKTIIFCNKIETCRKVENILTRCDRKGVHMRVLSFHAALTQESRVANMKEFLNTHSEKDYQFLVCTDRASRGIDFAGVDHVILFDFPRDPSEYVRRVGRTARGAGGKGTAFVFVVGKQVSLARRIMERNQKGQPLHDVPYI